MHLITSATVVATTARANDITLFASLELSKSKWVVTITSRNRTITGEYSRITGR